MNHQQMRIKDQTIRSVQEAADIVEVVEDYCSLKKKGQNYWALSPFTDEKTPSFSVSPAKGIYKCFSTGKGGDAISFVMEMEGFTFLEAIRHLAKKYHIEIQEEEEAPGRHDALQQKESLYVALNFAKTFFAKNLMETQEGRGIGLSYFRERGFLDQTIERFELGYALEGWNHLESEALTKGFTPEILEAAGLVLTSEKGGKYDRFRGRVVFPIHNISGRVVGFGARTLKKDEKPKYINSPESEVYYKSQILYGLFQAKNAIRAQDNCYLVEGYTDVISLHQGGIENVVASSGTSLTEEQIKAISRYTQNITVLYDGDPAGIKAAVRGLNLILEKGLNVRLATFPDNDDPDSYMRKVGAGRFKDYLRENTRDFILFMTGIGLTQAEGDPLKKAELIRDLVETIVKIPDPIKRSTYYKECSNLLKIEEDILIDEGNKILLKAYYKQRKEVGPAQENPDAAPDALEQELALEEIHQVLKTGKFNGLQERETIRILLEYGHMPEESGSPIAFKILTELSGLPFYDPTYHQIIETFRQFAEQGKVPEVKYFMHEGDEDLKREVVDLITEKWALSENWGLMHGIIAPGKDANLSSVIYSNLMRVKFHALGKLCKEALDMLGKATNEEEETVAQMVFLELKKEQAAIGKQLGIVIT